MNGIASYACGKAQKRTVRLLKEWTLASALVWIVRRSVKEVDRLAPDSRLCIGRLGDLIADCEEAWIEELRPSLFTGTLQVVAAGSPATAGVGHWPASPCSDPAHLYRRASLQSPCQQGRGEARRRNHSASPRRPRSTLRYSRPFRTA